MNEFEILEYLGPEEYHRGIVAEEKGRVVGWIGWNRLGGQFYAYALFCDPDFPHSYLAINQALRKACRACGQTKITFAVDVTNTEYLERIVAQKRNRIVSYLIQMEV